MPDNEVRLVLERAHWSESDIVDALTVLRADPYTTGLQRMQQFRTDMEFSSSELSRLLGVDVVIDPDRISKEHSGPRRNMPGRMVKHALATSTILLLVFGMALGMGTISAYLFELGPFGLP